MKFRRRVRRPRRLPAGRRSKGRTRTMTRHRRVAKRRSGVSRKAILNLTSVKKADNMLSWTRNDPADLGVVGPTVLSGTYRYQTLVWMPTARNLSNGPNQRGGLPDPSTRTSQTCFMRGVKETIVLATSTNNPWLWRRICFKFRGNMIITADVGEPDFVEVPLWHRDDSKGFTRGTTRLLPSLDTTATQVYAKLVNLLFKGVEGTDWSNFMIAKTDNIRLDIVYDKTTRITSGNDVGTNRTFRRWHGMNKNLVYNDDEFRGGLTDTYLSVADKRGMGDYYIVDLFDAGPNAAGEDELSFDPHATLYWHEK